ncbi:hypothetical protein [Hyalangium versicolor]|uniref:hypothetical protein n=1 Tax=Hyalangium versicolor TaxID=2861190 RepID=UPI001CCF5461|nr:hypothetical protein [Hyalangium versicolor]
MSRSLLLSSLLVLTVGCAGAGNGLRAHMGQSSNEPMVVSSTYVTGPSSSLSLREDGMRGRFRDRPVELKWDYQQVTGMFGTQPAKLELSEGDDTRASGTLGGTPVDLLLKDDVMLARVGMCSYFMRRVEGGYAGKRDCSTPLEEEFYVDFPQSLQERPLGQMATLLTLTLFSYTESFSPTLSPARFTLTRDFARGTPATYGRRCGR